MVTLFKLKSLPRNPLMVGFQGQGLSGRTPFKRYIYLIKSQKANCLVRMTYI